MTNRGRAVVVKKDKYMHEWVNSKGDVVSPPSSSEQEKENRPKRTLSQKLSSHVPAPAPSAGSRQGSPSTEQSAARRREALAHLFDHHTSAQDQDAPVPSVEPATAPPLASLLDSVLLEQAQPSKRTIRESKSTTPAKELDRSVNPIPRKSLCVQQPTPISHGTPSRPPSKAPSLQPIEQPDHTYNMASANNFIPTNQHRNMRACMVCSIVKTQQQFLNQGCPNCEKFLDLRGNTEMIQDCTSQVFEGLITISDTSRSWVARWQRLEGYVPGVYAVQVEGILPEDVINSAEENGVHYIPRDGSVNEALPTDA